MNDRDPAVPDGAASAEEKFMQAISGAGWRPPTPKELGELLAEYEVLEIGRVSSTAAIYKARQVALDRLVSIKVLPKEMGRDSEFAERFQREAKMLARLKHPNIITMYGFGTTTAGHLYLVTEHVEGATLHDLIHTGVMNPKLALKIVSQLCEGLACAHREGIVHRDIKPINILVDVKGRAKVAHFGLAYSTNPNAGPSLTMKGVVIGTPDYMAPERRRGAKVDQRADVYSLGVVLHEALTQEIPGAASEPASKKSGLPRRVDEVIARALAKEPEQRFQSTMEMKLGIDSVFDPNAAPLIPPPAAAVGQATVAPKSSDKKTELQTANRAPWLAIAAGVLVLGAVAAAVFALRPTDGAGPIAREEIPASEAPGQESEMPAPEKPDAAPTGPGIREPIPSGSRPKRTTRRSPDAEMVRTPQTEPGTPAPIAAATSQPMTAPPAATPSPATMPAPAMAAATPVPAPAPAPAAVTPEQRLAAVEAQFEAAYNREVVNVADAALAGLRSQYEAGIDGEIARLLQLGKITDTIPLRNERARVGRGDQLPESEDAALPASLKLLRSAYRTGAAKIAKDRELRVKPLRDWHLRQLDALAAEFARTQNFEGLQIVKQRRDSLTAEWEAEAAKSVGMTAAASPTESASTAPGSGVSSWRKAAQLAFNFGGRLEIRVDGKQMAATGESNLPAKRFEIVRLELTDAAKNEKLTDADLAPLALCKDLEEFRIDRASVSASGLEVLRGLPALRILRVSYCKQVNDDFMPIVASLPSLANLELHYNEIGRSGLKHLARSTKLRRLTLHGPNNSGGGLAALAVLPITELSLAELRDLASLDLSGFKQIKSIALIAMREGKSKLFEQVQRLKGREFVRFSACDVNDDDLAKLANLGFSTLELEGGTIRGPGLASLRSCRSLSRLRLNNCNVTDSTLEAIGRDLSGIRILNVSGTGQVQPAAFKILNRCRNLRELSVEGGIADDSVAAEIANINGLERVNCSGCPLLSAAGLHALAKLKTLKHLVIRNCSKVSDADVTAFKKQRPDVTVEV